MVDQHIHQQEKLDCDILHKQTQNLSLDFPSNYDIIPQHFYNTTFNEAPQVINVAYHSKKNPRGPPIIA